MFNFIRSNTIGGRRAPASSARAQRRATLQVSAERAWLLADEDGRRFWSFPPASSALEILREATRLLRLAEFGAGDSEAAGGRPAAGSKDPPPLALRLVLDGGFHCLSEVSTARWPRGAQEVLPDLAAVCPIGLAELVTASLPVARSIAWATALPADEIASWRDAADQLGIELAGIWTAASATIERLLEQPTGRPFEWSDGRTGVAALPEPQSDAPTGGGAATAGSSGLAAIRVTRTPGRPYCTKSLMVGEGEDAPPVEMYPALAAHGLARIDPSESFNLARGAFASAALSRSRQRPLASAMWLAALALLVVGVAARNDARSAERRGEACAREMAALLAERQSSAPASAAMPLDGLQKQLNLWRNARERGELRRRGGSQLALLANWFQTVPPGLQLNVTHLRSAGGELLVDGQLGSQAEVRQLAESMTKLHGGGGADAVRTTPGREGVVGFSIRVSLAQPKG